MIRVQVAFLWTHACSVWLLQVQSNIKQMRGPTGLYVASPIVYATVSLRCHKRIKAYRWANNDTCRWANTKGARQARHAFSLLCAFGRKEGSVTRSQTCSNHQCWNLFHRNLSAHALLGVSALGRTHTSPLTRYEQPTEINRNGHAARRTR